MLVRRKRQFITLCVFFSFLLIGKGFSQNPGHLRYNIINSFASPGPSPQGLAWDGKNLWVSDDSTKTIYRLDPSNGKILSSFPSPGAEPKGLAWDGTHLLLLENQRAKVYRLSVSDESLGSIISSINVRAAMGGHLENGQVRGLTWDGKYLYICFEAGWSSQIVKIDVSGTSTVFFTYTRGFPKGLACDRKYIWNCCDAAGVRLGLVDQYKLSNGLRVNSFDTPGYYPSGLTYDGRYFWLADNGAHKIYKIEIVR